METEHVGRGWKDWEELGRTEATGKGPCRVASFDRGPMFHKELKGQMMMMMNFKCIYSPFKNVSIYIAYQYLGFPEKTAWRDRY